MSWFAPRMITMTKGDFEYLNAAKRERDRLRERVTYLEKRQIIDAEMRKVILERRANDVGYLASKIELLIEFIDEDQKILQQVYCIQSKWPESKVRAGYVDLVKRYKHRDVPDSDDQEKQTP